MFYIAYGLRCVCLSSFVCRKQESIDYRVRLCRGAAETGAGTPSRGIRSCKVRFLVRRH